MEGSHAARREAVSFGRIVSFTDGVFAIAITLLVLNFEVPHIHEETERQLAHLVSRLAGDFGAYFLTFAVVGRMWVVHHRLFSTLETFDGRLITLNLTYLAMIVLVPFRPSLSATTAASRSRRPFTAECSPPPPGSIGSWPATPRAPASCIPTTGRR